MTNFVKEACVESLQEALEAEKLGADRVELCADLSQDGITPERNIIERAKAQLKIPFRVMIRPRGGDFVYSEAEFEVRMLSSRLVILESISLILNSRF